MECCQGSVADFMKKDRIKFTESMVRHILRDICSGLKFLHQHNIVHLDIKPGKHQNKTMSQQPPQSPIVQKKEIKWFNFCSFNLRTGFNQFVREHFVLIHKKVQTS